MSKFLVALKSRTAWAIVVMVLVNGLPSVQDQIRPDLLPLVDAVLGLLAIYFRVNRKADL